MFRPRLELADIFRQYGDEWRRRFQGHISYLQYKVMSAIERCRSSALGGHIWHCDNCHHEEIAYNSCRNRHCPKCQASAAKRWLAARQQDLLPVDYFHVVFTLPAPIAEMALQNQAILYTTLFQAAAKTLTTIALDPKHLGARIGVTMVLHTWGSALTHHPHVHCVVPGGGLSPDGEHWVRCRPGFFLPVRVLSRLFRRLYLEQLAIHYAHHDLQFHGQQTALNDPESFNQAVSTARQQEWVVYAKRPFAGSKAVLSYLSRYTHRIAISNSRLVAVNDQGVSFKWKDYRYQDHYRHRVMMLSTDEFIRRFLLHVLPSGFHRIRYYGLFANAHRVENVNKARAKIGIPGSPVTKSTEDAMPSSIIYRCPNCASEMVIMTYFERGQQPRAPPIPEAA